MAVADRPTVWVLGAGFSKSLGGPLLKDLFQPENVRDLQEHFGHKYGNLAYEMFWTKAIFNKGKGYYGRWEDAEEFLSHVEDVLRTSNAKSTVFKNFSHDVLQENSGLSAWVDPKLHEAYKSVVMGNGVKRSFAAECSRFLLRRPAPETWIPYEMWADTLDPELDTVVSFNYDQVLEKIPNSNFSVVLATKAAKRQYDPRTTVPVLKLHGSVDWVMKDGIPEKLDIEDVLSDPEHNILIASPGRSKNTSVDEELSGLWSWAKDKLSTAHTIVFLGYSFPKSDTRATTEIIQAIKKDKHQQRQRRIEVVLGPNTDHYSVRRVMAMLRSAKGRRRLYQNLQEETPEDDPKDHLCLTAQPMWIEDCIWNFSDHLDGVVDH